MKIFLLLFSFGFASCYLSQKVRLQKQLPDGTFIEINYDSLQSVYTNAILLDPKSEKNYYNRGQLNFDFQDYEKASQDFTSVILLDSNLKESALLKRALIKSNIADFDGSIKDCTGVLEINPLNYHAYFQRANSKFELKNYTEAILDANIAIQSNNDSLLPASYYIRGRCKYELKEYSDAIIDFTKSFETEPYFSISLDWKIKSLYELKSYEEVINICNNNIPLFDELGIPNSLQFERGFCKYMMKDYKNAIEDFSNLITKEDKNEKAYYYRALSRMNLDDKKNGCFDYKKALELDPNSKNTVLENFCNN